METNENKIATQKCKEVAAQSFTILIALRFTHAGAWYYLLNIPPDVRIKYTFFFNRNNIKKVHDRLYYLENGGRSVCGTAAIGGQQRPASPEKRKFSYSPNTLDYFPFNTLYTLATSDDHDFPRKIVLSLDRATTGDPEERESRALSSRRKNRVYTAASGSPKRLVFFFRWVYFYLYDRREFRSVPRQQTLLVQNRGKSRRAPDRINVENPSNES